MTAEPENRVLFTTQQQDVAQDGSRMIRLEVTQLRPYDRNPRRCQNNEYERIKASIRAQGLDQPLVVTRRPAVTDYMLLAGGNTRLRAMLDLYQETGDEAFLYLDCLYKSWVAESDVLLSHLRENELRDNLYFIDKARAVLEAKALLEAEMQGRPLSQRRLSELIAGRGLSYSQTLISRMVYAVQTLWPLIPQALSAGMGTPQVARIQALERATRTIWCKRSLGAEGEFDEVFAALCRRYDSPDWVTDVLQGALETEIADAAEVDLALVRLELDAQIAGRSLPAISPDILEGASMRELPKEAAASSGTESVVVGSHVNPSGELQHVRVCETTKSKNGNRLEADEQSELVRLRQLAYQLANQLAHAHGMGHLIKPLSEQGLGFVVQDVPDETHTEVPDEDLARLVTAVWWQLVACSEVMVAPSVQVVAQLKEGSSFQIAIADQAPNQLFAAMSPLEPGLVGSHLWRWLTDDDWQTLVALTETYRVLHRISRESGQPLWHA